jgi:hypothetical protein
MPFPRPIDSTLHGATDYTLGSLLMTALPRLAGVEGTESATQMRIAGATHVGYSTVTDYPLGFVKAIPYKVHLALDALGAVAVGALPFITGQYRKGTRHWVPHVALAAFELQALLLSDPRGKGDFHGDVEAVRAANELNPHERIYNGASAVAPAQA